MVPPSSAATWSGTSISPRNAKSIAGQLLAQPRARAGSRLYVADPTQPIVSRPDQPLVDALCLVPGLVDRGEDRAGPVEVRRPGVGQVDAAGGAAQQRHPQLGLELPDLLGQRRLGHVQALGGPAEVPLLGDGDEVAQVTKLHGFILSESQSWRNGYFSIWTVATYGGRMNTPSESSLRSGSDRDPDKRSDVVICEPVRTPVGRFGGALSTLSAVDLASLTLTELVAPHRARRGRRRRRRPRPGLRQRRVPGDRPDRRPRRRPRHRRPRRPGRPPLRVRASRPCCTPPARSPPAPRSVVVAGGAESMSQVEHYALGLRTGVRAGGVELIDRLDRARDDRRRQGPPRPRRHAGDRREPARGVRHRPRGAGRARDPLPAAGRRRPRGRPVRRRAGPGDRPRPARQARRRRRPRRAPARRDHPRATSPRSGRSG